MPDEKQPVALALDNFLPRGATMQGTGEGVLAMVLYTGNDSKLVLNQGRYKYKTSNTETNLNKIFIGQMFQIIFFSTIFAIANSVFVANHID